MSSPGNNIISHEYQWISNITYFYWIPSMEWNKKCMCNNTSWIITTKYQHVIWNMEHHHITFLHHHFTILIIITIIITNNRITPSIEAMGSSSSGIMVINNIINAFHHHQLPFRRFHQSLMEWGKGQGGGIWIVTGNNANESSYTSLISPYTVIHHQGYTVIISHFHVFPVMPPRHQ